MTITFTLYVETRYIGSRVEEEVSFDISDDATEAEIAAEKQAYARDWYQDQIEWGFVD